MKYLVLVTLTLHEVYLGLVKIKQMHFRRRAKLARENYHLGMRILVVYLGVSQSNSSR